MRHVFVETNWVVGYAAPEHHQIPAARRLAERAGLGECRVYLPALCLGEARRTIQKFQPRHEADAIRRFLRRADVVAPDDAQTTRRVLDTYENTIRAELHSLDSRLAAIKAQPGFEVFGLDDAMLARSIELSTGELSSLQAFDQAILAAILVRAERLREQRATDIVFCELDSDLQPWDKNGNPKSALLDVYNQAQLWVYRDFEFSGPARPSTTR
ncbi:MAG: hypothetical protein RL701_198 [Pseudomonadota bacterium]